MIRLYAALWPTGRLLVWLTAAAFAVALVVQHVAIVHADRGRRQELCAARLAVVKARNPLIAKGWFPVADDCVNLASLTGEQVR